MDIEEREVLERMQNEPTNLDVRRSVVDATVNNVFDSRIEYQSDKDSVII